MAVETVQHRRKIPSEQQHRGHAADHDDGQRPLGLRTDLRGKGRRQQSAQGRQVGHHHRAHALAGPFDDGLLQRPPLRAQRVEVRDQQQPVHDGDAEERNEADGRRNAEVGAGQAQGPNAAHRHRQDVAEHDHGIQPGSQGRIQQDENQAQRQRNDPHQAGLGILHFLELAGPDGAIRGLEQVLRLLPRLIDRTGQVAAANAELHRDQAFCLFAVDHRGAGLLELAVGVNGPILADGAHQVAQPQPRRVAERIGGVGQAAADRGRSLAGAGCRRDKPRSLGLDHLVVAHVHGNIEDRRFAAPPPCRPADRHVESFLSLDHLRDGLASQGACGHVVHVGHLNAPPLALFRVGTKLQVRLPLDAEQSHVLEARARFA